MEHAGESGVQFSVGAKMEAYGRQAAATSNQFCCKSREEEPCNCQVYLAGSGRGQFIFRNWKNCSLLPPKLNHLQSRMAGA